MHFNSEGEFSKDVLDAIEAFEQSRKNLPTQDFQKSPLWSEKLKAGQYEIKSEFVCNCTATERKFLDKIREKGKWNEMEEAVVIGRISEIHQINFESDLKELVNE